MIMLISPSGLGYGGMILYNTGMKGREGFRRVSAERCLGNLASAVRAVTRTGSNWAGTVALGWRLGTEFDRANVNERNEISGSRLGSQRWQTQGDARPLSATAGAPGGGWTRS
jgi:hypothetical protein